ncbi:MAG: LUD domain-containing protein [Candidatus Aenigmarchaeota archaeon]|nr:LUD domain-containing protein [Candidatus Aenigmarchaeota archaeon]
MSKWDKLATGEEIERTIKALKENGIDAIVVDGREEAKKEVLKIIPRGSEVMGMSSTTLEESGIDEVLNSGRFDSVKQKLMKMDRTKQGQEMNKLGATPGWAVGSVHAVTQDGKALIASNSGSQLPAYAYAASNVIWVVGTQKIVKNFEDGMKRVYEYVLPLESERVKKAYGMPHSNVNKLLVVNNEIKAGRIRMILVKEKLGF